MKALILTLLFIVGAFAQEPASNWGGAFDWSTSFRDADSTKISTTQTAINGTDTLYTKALAINENTDGIYAVWAYWEYTDAASDSLMLDMRLGAIMKRSTFTSDAVIKWGDWNLVLKEKSTNTVEVLSFSTPDSSWFIPANIRQYRTYRNDTETVDTCTVYITDFLR